MMWDISQTYLHKTSFLDNLSEWLSFKCLKNTFMYVKILTASNTFSHQIKVVTEDLDGADSSFKAKSE